MFSGLFEGIVGGEEGETKRVWRISTEPSRCYQEVLIFCPLEVFLQFPSPLPTNFGGRKGFRGFPQRFWRYPQRIWRYNTVPGMFGGYLQHVSRNLHIVFPGVFAVRFRVIYSKVLEQGWRERHQISGVPGTFFRCYMWWWTSVSRGSKLIHSLRDFFGAGIRNPWQVLISGGCKLMCVVHHAFLLSNLQKKELVGKKRQIRKHWSHRNSGTFSQARRRHSEAELKPVGSWRIVTLNLIQIGSQVEKNEHVNRRPDGHI